MKIKHLATFAAVVGAQFHPPYSRAADAVNSNENVQALIQRINDLEQKVKVLERNREVDQETVKEKSKDFPTISLGANGLNIRSADSNFTMIAHGYIQGDARFYLDAKGGSTVDTFLLRRVRPIVEGTFYDKFDYRLMLDLGSGNVAGSTANNNNLLDDAYVNARLWNQYQVQAGKYKSPIGLERLQSTADLLFVETGFATELTPNYDLGASIHNRYFDEPFGYSIGIYNGATDNASDDQDADEGKDVVGRLFAQPFLKTDIEPLRKLGVGVAGSVGDHSGTLASYKTPGQQTFFSYGNAVTADGRQYRVDPQGYYYWGPFGILGEYVLSSQEVKSSAGGGVPANEQFNNSAWQVEASYFITGEENSFKYTSLQHVVPLHPVFAGGWGALEAVARVQQLTLDKNIFTKYAGISYATSTSARQATAWGVGLNWYLNSNLKLNLNYEATSFEGGSSAAGSVTARPEHAILSRVQFMF